MTDCPQILQRLEDEDPEILREAAQDAGDFDCDEAVPRLIDLLENSNLGVQEAAEISLRQIGGARTVQSLAVKLRTENAQVRNLAMDILRQIGNEDINTMFDLLQDRDPDIRIFAADILGSTANILAVPHLCRALLEDQEVNVRYQAAVSLGDLAFIEAAKCLHQAINDEEWVQFSVIEALLKIRSESSINVMVKAMQDSTDLVSSMIIDALAELGDIKAAPLLIKRLETSPSALRNKIVKAVVQIMGGRSLALLPTLEQTNFKAHLLEALCDEDVDIQDKAVEGLVFLKVAEAAEPIVNLAGTLDPEKDEHQDRLERLARALAHLGAFPALEAALHSGEPARVALAIRALRELPGPQSSALLMNFFKDNDRNVQRSIIDALVLAAGVGDESFFLNLLGSHNDGHVLKQSLRFLGQTDRKPQNAEQVFALLDHPYPDVREAALEACIAIGGQAVIDRFQDMFASPDPDKRAMAVMGLGNVGCADHLELIRQALEDEAPSVRKAALEAGTKLCGLNEETLALISQRIQDEDQEVRLHLVSLLGECDCSGVNVVPLLKMALADAHDWVRVRAVEALGRLGVADAVPALVDLMRQGSRLVAIKVVWALGRIGGQSAFQTLLDVLDSDDHELIAAAEEAILHLQQREEGLE